MCASVDLRAHAGEALSRHAGALHAGAPEVLAATAQPVIHHRSSDFRGVHAGDRAAPGGTRRTENDVLLFTSAGTAAMESAVANVCSPGDRVLVVSHGYFGERWAAIAGATASTSTTFATSGASCRAPTR